ncbi:hypothetical protein [Kiritimatiella glycovorans]|uniref:Uncharacterized protein n=1 Tax=Kiritimatiella glycovorans TaxID=1307763 RepID=A0A0G3EGJ5_9BACT|nr:hypothetical protein [Kiritimatiella glycovorans]AKJ65463.1 hypothetical protein L21SP4_02236 [Kiritimatiella glycovorans]
MSDAPARVLAVLLPAFCAAGTAEAIHDWDRYRPIVERAPFGAAAAEGGEETGHGKAVMDDRFAKHLRICTLYEGFDGRPQAGLVDNTSDKSVWLKPGERYQGIELTGVDVAAGTVTMRRDGKKAVLKLKPLDAPATPHRPPEPVTAEKREESAARVVVSNAKVDPERFGFEEEVKEDSRRGRRSVVAGRRRPRVRKRDEDQPAGGAGGSLREQAAAARRLGGAAGMGSPMAMAPPNAGSGEADAGRAPRPIHERPIESRTVHNPEIEERLRN